MDENPYKSPNDESKAVAERETPVRIEIFSRSFWYLGFSALFGIGFWMLAVCVAILSVSSGGLTPALPWTISLSITVEDLLVWSGAGLFMCLVAAFFRRRYRLSIITPGKDADSPSRTE